MTQHFLDGFAMYYPGSGKVIGYLWRSLLSPRWWLWQAELKWKRMVCRCRGHRFGTQHSQTYCLRCDWYDDVR